MIDQDKAFSIRLTGQHVHDSFYVSSFADQSKSIESVALYVWVLCTELGIYASAHTDIRACTYMQIGTLNDMSEICDVIHQAGMVQQPDASLDNLPSL